MIESEYEDKTAAKNENEITVIINNQSSHEVRDSL